MKKIIGYLSPPHPIGFVGFVAGVAASYVLIHAYLGWL